MDVILDRDLTFTPAEAALVSARATKAASPLRYSHAGTPGTPRLWYRPAVVSMVLTLGSNQGERQGACHRALHDSATSRLERTVVSAHTGLLRELFAYATSIVHQHDAALGRRSGILSALFRPKLSYGRSVDNPRVPGYTAWSATTCSTASAPPLSVVKPRFCGRPLQRAGPQPEAILQHAQLARNLASLLSPRENGIPPPARGELSYDEIAAILKVRWHRQPLLQALKLLATGDQRLRHLTSWRPSFFKTEAAIHPDIEILISYCDGELAGGQLASVVEAPQPAVIPAPSNAANSARPPPVPLPPQALETLRARLQELIAEQARPPPRGRDPTKTGLRSGSFFGSAGRRPAVPFVGR